MGEKDPLKGNKNMNIVLLERNSVGTDVDVSCYEALGNVTSYRNTVTVEEVKERVKDADVIIANKAPMRRESLEDAPHVKLICVLATGYDMKKYVHMKRKPCRRPTRQKLFL